MMLLAHIRHEARLNRVGPDGRPRRSHVVDSAARGNKLSLAELDGPPMPDALAYLWEWFLEARMGCGEGLAGAAPLTWATVDSWSRHTDTFPMPHEARALFAIDAAFRNTGDATIDQSDSTDRTRAFPAPKAIDLSNLTDQQKAWFAERDVVIDGAA